MATGSWDPVSRRALRQHLPTTGGNEGEQPYLKELDSEGLNTMKMGEHEQLKGFREGENENENSANKS